MFRNIGTHSKKHASQLGKGKIKKYVIIKRYKRTLLKQKLHLVHKFSIDILNLRRYNTCIS